MHVTFIAGDLSPEYFGMPVGPVPNVVLTVENSTIPFSSIGISYNITDADGRQVSKVFYISNIKRVLIISKGILSRTVDKGAYFQNIY